jgi:integrase
MERVLDYATTKQHREGDNPARWRGHLDNVLPKPGKVHRVEHQRALPYAEAPALVVVLKQNNTSASRALLLTLLCATRTSETLEATWSEINLERREWRIPGTRMKAGKEHRIPLSEAAVAILQAQLALRRERVDCVFPGQRGRKCLSNMAMTNVRKRLNWLERTTVHGLRSTFRDWVGETTSYPERMAEVALAHQLTDKVQAAYFRADLMEQRREMMSEWAAYLCGEGKGKGEGEPETRGRRSGRVNCAQGQLRICCATADRLDQLLHCRRHRVTRGKLRYAKESPIASAAEHCRVISLVAIIAG